jgi:hypothetical protein
MAGQPIPVTADLGTMGRRSDIMRLAMGTDQGTKDKRQLTIGKVAFAKKNYAYG